MKTFLIILMLMASAVSHAEVNPYAEGTEKVRLTEAERTDLLQYLNQSKVSLEKALIKAAGKPFEDANVVYFRAVRDVVIASYKERPRTELLMRHILNQAMQLTTGVPGADGKSIAQAGVLDGAANPALNTIILEDSIKLALKYVEQDKVAGEAGSLNDLPYLGMAAARIALAREWFTGVPQIDRREAFLYIVLQNWLTEANGADQMHKPLVAKELGDIDSILKSIDEDTEATAAEKARVLRVALLQLLADLNENFKADIEAGQALMQQSAAPTPGDDVTEQPKADEAPVVDQPLKPLSNTADDPAATTLAFDLAYGKEDHIDEIYHGAARGHIRIPYYTDDDSYEWGADISGSISTDYSKTNSKFENTGIDVTVSPMAGTFRKQSDSDKTYFVAQWLPVPLGYTYGNDQAVQAKANGFALGLSEGRAAVKTKVNGTKVMAGVDLNPVRWVWGNYDVQGRQYKGISYFKGDAWLKVGLGPVGNLADRFETDHIYGSHELGESNPGAFYVDTYSNWVGIDNVFGSPVGVGYTFTAMSSHGEDWKESPWTGGEHYSANPTDLSTRIHMVGVKGQF